MSGVRPLRMSVLRGPVSWGRGQLWIPAEREGAYGERGGEGVDDLFHGDGIGYWAWPGVSGGTGRVTWVNGCQVGNLKRNVGRDIRLRSEIQAGKERE